MSALRVARNKAVFFTYSIKDEHGATVEQSDMPIGYVHGASSNLLEKLEQALDGRSIGDVVEVIVEPKDGFGEHDPALTFTDELANTPPELRFVGAEAQMQNEDGELKTFIVTKIENGKLTVDGNHPYAGKSVTYRATITEIRAATPQEIVSGCPEGQAPPPIH